MRILLISPIVVPHFLWAGSHRVVYDIAKSLIRRGHSVVVLTSDMFDKRTKIMDATHETDPHNYANTVRARTASRKLTEMTNMTISIDTVAFLKRELQNFDVVHANEYRTFENIALHHYVKKYGIPYVLQAHGSLPRIMVKERLKWIYDVLFGYRLLRDASKVIALSRIEAEQYGGMGVPEEKIAVIRNGIDVSEYTDLPPKGSFKRKFDVDDDEKIVLYVGRLHKSKGLDLLAYAFKIVSADDDNVRLVVVGPDDGYAAEFSKLTSDLGVEEKVLLTGFVDKNIKLAAFVDSDVFVTPRFSGFPVTFLEACLAGCPIVTASDELDWINNNVGYVTEYSSDAIANGVVSVLQDEQVNGKFRNNCRRMISNFDISTVTRQIEKIYKEALSCTCC